MKSNLPSSEHSIAIQVRPAKEVGVYEIVVRNTGTKAVWDVQFATYDLLRPGDFGLDDTHMPASLTREELAQIRFIGLKDSECIVRRKWGPLSRYKGRCAGTHFVTFSPTEDGATRLGLRVPFTVYGDDGLAFRPDLTPLPNSAKNLSLRVGIAVGRFFRKHSPK